MKRYYMASLTQDDSEKEYQLGKPKRITDEEYSELCGATEVISEGIHVRNRPANATVLGEEGCYELNMVWSEGE